MSFRKPEAVHKGRGATFNPEGRFETLTRYRTDDGWVPDGEPARAPQTVVRPDAARSLITRNDSPDLSFALSVNPYRGCEHGCIYCFARPSHAYLNLSPGLDFETQLFYKPDAAALFERELRKPGYRCEVIVLGVNTDAWQPIERELKVTRSLLEVALRFRQPLGVITKGATLMERDLDLLAALARERLVSVTLSITSLNDEIKRTLEPRTASPAARLRLVRKLADAGVPVGVNVAPVIPVITDPELERILEAARDAGAQDASYVMLRLPWEVKDLFEHWLREHHPLKADHVLSLLKQMHGGEAQHRAAAPAAAADEDATQEAQPETPTPAPSPFRGNPYYSAEWGVRGRGRGPFAQMFEQRFRLACRRLGLDRTDRMALDTTRFAPPPAAGDQFSLI
ncbi:MAG TPA: PA0069 family radical SAM protein [Candidatus Binatia bacterium]|nr:PA0069 family radical SAM protein [Candidatus Binatia bacterium]